MCKALGLFLFPALLVSMVVAMPVRSETPTTPPWKLDDLILAERLGDWDVSPDGEGTVWVRSTIEKVKGVEKSVSNLWWSSLDGSDSSALTRGTDQHATPTFSPDGKNIAFLSSRKLPGDDSEDLAKRQLWVLPARGEAFPVSRFDSDVGSFAWADDKALIVLAAESRSAWHRERKEIHDSANVVDDLEHEPPTRLFRVPLEGSPRRITHNLDWIRSMAVAADGSQAVVMAHQDLKYNFDQKLEPRIFLVNLSSGKSQQILVDSDLAPRNFKWAPDHSGFYFTNEYTRHPQYRMATITELYFYDLSKQRASKVDLDWPQGLSGPYLATADGVLALLADGIYERATRLSREDDRWVRRNLQGTHAAHISSWVLAKNGKTLVYQSSAANRPQQLFGALLHEADLREERALTAINKSFEKKNTGRVDPLRWKGAKGEEVEGLLHYPLDWTPGTEPRPLMVDIHGGPAAADLDRWDQRWSGPQLLFRQRGAFVLQINYHGSAGYGLDWVESIQDHYYELEVVDILNGVDLVIEKGLVDEDRLGCTGWSNGGILTAELITRTERFKAASVGAADVEWISDWANVDFGAAFDNYYFGGTPWEKTEVYLEKSPFFRLGAVTTPTIIYTGTDDTNVPPHQSWSLYRALQYLANAPTRLVIFPGEPHSLRRVAHQRRKAEEELAWFDKYLFARAPGTPAAIKEGSLLAGILGRQKAATTDGSLGLRSGVALVPETVTLGTLEVGRFEVTRAQFASFDDSFEAPPGTENFPATTVSFERAKEYAAWLSKVTGRPFRLPSEKEAEGLAQEAGKGGNTLDRWAGYSANPEDAAILREAAARLPGEAPLLLPVGSLPGQGEDPVFDLDGNAAEWVVANDGEGKALGPSADQPLDERNPGNTADPAYIGLRVVVGSPPRENGA